MHTPTHTHILIRSNFFYLLSLLQKWRLMYQVITKLTAFIAFPYNFTVIPVYIHLYISIFLITSISVYISISVCGSSPHPPFNCTHTNTHAYIQELASLLYCDALESVSLDEEDAFERSLKLEPRGSGRK